MLHLSVPSRLLLLVVAFTLCLPFVGKGQVSLKEAAKVAKISPDLLRMMPTKAPANANARQASPTPIAPDEPLPDDLVSSAPYQIANGKIAINAVANEDGLALLAELQPLGLTDESVYERVVFGFLPIDRLGDLQNVASLRFARPAYRPRHSLGKTTSQGDQAMRANVARQNFGVTGAGQKIGILSDSYNNLGGAAAGVASNDLPANVQVLDDFVPGTVPGDLSDEGRGMAELIYDVAPGAALALNTAFKGEPGFANGILNLAKAGCNIIVDDIGYLASPFFQDGIVAQAVNRVVSANKVAYFSAAGNSGRQSYTNRFVNSGRPAPGLTLAEGRAHNFLDGNITQRFTLPPRGSIALILQWDDPYYSVSGGRGARTDLDILFYSNGRLIPQLSSAFNNIGDDPYEGIFVTNTSSVSATSFDIVIVNFAGPDPSVIKWLDYGGDAVAQYPTRSSTITGHPNAEGAIAVGASAYFNTPAFNANLTAPVINGFSSAGGTPILFNTRGERIAPIVRQKPEVVGPDGANTTFFPPGPLTSTDFEDDGFPNFFGTSAAAPHVAAVAALMQEQARGALSPADIRTNLIRSAIDMNDPSTAGFDFGFDFGTGFGFVQADRALASGAPFALVQPLFNCATGQLTLSTVNGNGSTVEFRIAGVTEWTTNPVQILGPGLLNDPNTSTIQIMARQGGQMTSLTFNFREFCRPTPGPVVPGTSFTLVQPLFNCLNGLLTIRTTAGNGSLIEYQIPGVIGWTTDPVQVLPSGVFLDPRTTTLLLQARQNGQVVSLNFNFRAFCVANYPGNTARTAALEPGSGLEVMVMENPTVGDYAEVSVWGAHNQPLQLKVSNSRGEWISEQSVDRASPAERRKVQLGRATGIYFLQVSTADQTKTVKILRQ